MDIKTARKAKGWTQQKLAEELKVSRGAVGQWEMLNGTRPDPRHAIAMLKLLPGLQLEHIYPANHEQGRAAA